MTEQHPHPDPVFIDKQHPAPYRALIRVAQATREVAEQAGLDRRLVELVNVRVSQLNGCAACLDTHTRAAMQDGETAQRLALLPAWREVTLYSDAERAALALAEALTQLPNAERLAEEQRAAADTLTDEQLAAIEWVVVAINAFNRVSIASHHPVTPRA